MTCGIDYQLQIDLVRFAYHTLRVKWLSYSITYESINATTGAINTSITVEYSYEHHLSGLVHREDTNMMYIELCVIKLPSTMHRKVDGDCVVRAM